MAPAVASISGFLIPEGDSFPSTMVHNSPAPAPINVASDLESNPIASTTHLTAPASTTSQATPITDGKSQPFPPAAIVGIILAVLIIFGAIFFFMRRHFIRQRAAKVTPARARASQVVISGPIDFQHVSSADGNPPLGNPNHKASMSIDTEKYAVNFGKLDSGLHDHVQTMQFARNPRQDRV